VVVQDAEAVPHAGAYLAGHARDQIGVVDRSGDLALFAFPDRTAAPDAAGTASTSPSCLGAGVDLFALTEDHDRLLRSFGKRFELIDFGRWQAEQA